MTVNHESYTSKPKGRPLEIGWLDTHEKQKNLVGNMNGNVVFIGDSIIKNLQYYKSVWNDSFRSKGYVNCGIGGDSIQNVRWRVKDLVFSKSIDCVVLHCGSNNLGKSLPIDIVNGIISIGLDILERYKYLSIVISAIISRDSASSKSHGVL